MGVFDKVVPAAGRGSATGGRGTSVPAPGGRSPRRGMPRFVRRAIVGLFLLAIIGGITLMLILVNYTMRFPDPMALRKNDATPMVRVLARDGKVLAERGQVYQFVPLDLLPSHVIEAVVATEDRRFFDHRGVDPIGLVRAMFANLRAGRYVQGGSTLSQQLAKNLFLSSERTMGRKIEELLLAIWLEVRLPKQDILELYLNRVYFGGGAYGIEAAARRYFDKPSRSLRLSEASLLAGLLKAPSKYAPSNSPALARARARVVLKKMLAAGYISQEAEMSAAAQSVKFADPSAGRELTGLEYAAEFVLERLPPLIGTGHREINIETTFDSGLQKRAQTAVEQVLLTEGVAAAAGQAAVAIVDVDGGIRALVGGRSWRESQFNRAIKSRRQPGSAFKPFVYLAAVEQGATPDTMVLDMPLNIGGWAPRNENGQHRGAMTLRQALSNSVNTIAARLQQDVGTKRVIATARRLGVKSELRPGPSLSLGTSEVSLIEMTGAYAVLASGGLAVEPHAVTRVRANGKTILYERSKSRSQLVVAPDHVGIMSSMLNTALVSGTGKRAALARHVAAGKTGTSQDFRDAWFVGYTAHLAGGVWVGNDDGSAMSRVMGGGLPATIWKAVMEAAHEKLPPSTLAGMQQSPLPPWASDTLRDSDRIVKPADPITDLLAHEIQVPSAAAKLSAGRPARTERAATAVAATTAAPAKPAVRPASVRVMLQPRARGQKAPAPPNNTDLIARAIEDRGVASRVAAEPGVALPPPATVSTAGSDLDRLLRSIDQKPQPGLMGLGLRP